MDKNNRYNCIMVTQDFSEIPVIFNPERYNFEIVHDEKEALNDVKMEDIDLFIIKDPLEHLLDEELYRIVTERVREEKKNIVVIRLIRNKYSNFEIKKFMMIGDSYKTLNFRRYEIDLEYLLKG